MEIFIARDGVEIGECDERDLPQLAREGQLQPTDHYWREGMETWLRLGDLLPPETWNPEPQPPAVTEKEEAPPAREEQKPVEEKREAPAEPKLEEPVAPKVEAPPTVASLAATQPIAIDDEEEEKPRAPIKPRVPFWRKWWFAPALIAAALFAFVCLGAYFIIGHRGGRITHDAALFPPAAQAPPPTAPRPENDEVRDKAAELLRTKLQHLPAKPEPPLHVFYYDLNVNMQQMLSLHAPWMATIRGREDTVDPQTDKTTVHSDFALQLEYRDGEWVFRNYSASVSDIVNEQTTEVVMDPRAPIPPSVVGFLGVKIPEPESR